VRRAADSRAGRRTDRLEAASHGAGGRARAQFAPMSRTARGPKRGQADLFGEPQQQPEQVALGAPSSSISRLR
jgi:hypothetical protein